MIDVLTSFETFEAFKIIYELTLSWWAEIQFWIFQFHLEVKDSWVKIVMKSLEAS